MMNIRQKILVMETDDSDLRSSAESWDIECGQIAERDITSKVTTPYNDVPVGLIGHPSEFYTYATPLHALGAGWRLMKPPTKRKTKRPTDCDCEDKGDPSYFITYEWWFEKIAMAGFSSNNTADCDCSGCDNCGSHCVLNCSSGDGVECGAR